MAKTPVQGATVVDLDAEESIGAAGAIGKVVSVAKRQAAGARREFEEAPHCPHCQGRMHMNLPVATTNFECLWRQYNLATGGMSAPSDRFPAFTSADIDPLNEWIKVRSRSRKLGPLTYGKMDSAGGGAATYSAARAAAKTDEDVDPKAAAKAAKSVKTGAAASTIPSSTPAKRGKVIKNTPEDEDIEAVAATPRKRATAAPVAVAAKSVSVKAAKPAKDFDLDSMELDDDEPVAKPVGKATPRNGTKPTPPSQGKSVLPVKPVKSTAPALAKTGGKRARALAGIK